MTEILALVVGALLAFVAQQFAAWRQHKRELEKMRTAGSIEHRAWLLQKRYETNLAFLELVDGARYRHYLGQKQKTDDASMARMQEITTRVGFVGSYAAKDSTMKLRDALADYVVDKPGAVEAFEYARNEFLADVRSLLVIEDETPSR